MKSKANGNCLSQKMKTNLAMVVKLSSSRVFTFKNLILH